MFIAALCEVYRSHLDRYIDLTRTVAALPGPTRSYGIASYIDGLQSAGRVEEAVELTETAIEAAREVGNPYWIAYTSWIVGLAYSKADAQRALGVWEEAVGYIRKHHVRFFEGFVARDAALLRTAEGHLEAALALFAVSIEAFYRAGNVAQLIITLASVPALFERLDRLGVAATLLGAMTREAASRHHVPTLIDLEERLAMSLGEETVARLTAVGAAMDLNETAEYASHQIELARAGFELEARIAELAGLTSREIQVLRLLAAGSTTRDIVDRLFIAVKTADNHIQHIYTKLGVSNRAAATRWAVEHGLNPPR
jgi:DNA-binding CsgD family transcriptional regulator